MTGHDIDAALHGTYDLAGFAEGIFAVDQKPGQIRMPEISGKAIICRHLQQHIYGFAVAFSFIFQIAVCQLSRFICRILLPDQSGKELQHLAVFHIFIYYTCVNIHDVLHSAASSYGGIYSHERQPPDIFTDTMQSSFTCFSFLFLIISQDPKIHGIVTDAPQRILYGTVI